MKISKQQTPADKKVKSTEHQSKPVVQSVQKKSAPVKQDKTNKTKVVEPQVPCSSNDISDDEYEYVEISELSSPIISRIKGIIVEYRIFLICLVFLLFSGVLIALGTTSSLILIIVAFVFLASAAVFMLYSSWKNMKEIKKKAEKAEKLLEEVKKQQFEEIEDE